MLPPAKSTLRALSLRLTNCEGTDQLRSGHHSCLASAKPKLARARVFSSAASVVPSTTNFASFRLSSTFVRGQAIELHAGFNSRGLRKKSSRETRCDRDLRQN